MARVFYPSKIYSKLYFLAYRPQYPVLNEPLNSLYGDLNQSCLSGCASLKICLKSFSFSKYPKIVQLGIYLEKKKIRVFFNLNLSST